MNKPQAENQLAPLNTVLRSKKNKELLAGALTHGLDMNRFIKCAWIQATTSPDIAELAQKNPTSVFRAMIQCAQMGLYPDGQNGDAYLVRFGNECVAMRGYKGKMRLFGENPAAASLPFVSDVIHENDEWELELGGSPKFTHKPAKKDRGVVTHYYAVARFADGTVMPKVMNAEEVEKFKDYAKTKKFWDSDHENTRKWMRIKTVIHQLMKTLPLAERVRDEMQREEALEDGTIEIDAYLDSVQLDGGAQPHIEGGEIKTTQGKPKEDVPPNPNEFLSQGTPVPIVTAEPVEPGEPPPGMAHGDPKPGDGHPFNGTGTFCSVCGARPDLHTREPGSDDDLFAKE